MSDYIEDFIRKGDLGSGVLRVSTAPSLTSNSSIEIANYGEKKIAGLRIPQDKIAVVHSAYGNYSIKNPFEHTRSMVDSIVTQGHRLRVTPLALANVVDSNSGEIELIKGIGEAMNEAAVRNKIGILNGENAILGNLINPAYGANVFGTAVSMTDKGQLELGQGVIGGVRYFAFDPKGQFIFMNSDGVGTKTDIYRRTSELETALYDSAAMKVDDSAKIGAKVVVLWDNIEMGQNFTTTSNFVHTAQEIGKKNGFSYMLNVESAQGRVNGYNVSGNAVCLVSDERLKNPLFSRPGDFLMAIEAKGPRSNGITAKRKLMEKEYGPNWHQDPKTREHLKFLTTPSIIFYGAFSELVDKGLASAVYHMSGGAFRGKLAKPLADQNLFVSMRDLFSPHKIERYFTEKSPDTIEASYEKCPMGNEGFISTRDPENARKILGKYGLRARTVGQIEQARKRTGLALISYDEKRVYFSGK